MTKQCKDPWRRAALMLALVFGPAAALAQEAPSPLARDEGPFLKANEDAMNAMMDGMAIKPSGDVDADFSAMMIPHHEGAMVMAQAELRYGRNEQLRRIAQEIIVDQQQEIVAMRLALGQSLPRSVPSPTQPAPVPQAVGAPASAAMMAMPGLTLNQGQTP